MGKTKYNYYKKKPRYLTAGNIANNNSKFLPKLKNTRHEGITSIGGDFIVAMVKRLHGQTTKSIAKEHSVDHKDLMKFFNDMGLSGIPNNTYNIETLIHKLILKQYNKDRRREAKYDERKHWKNHDVIGKYNFAKRYYTDPEFNLKCRLSSGLQSVLKGNYSSRTMDYLIGISFPAFCDHIESQFTDGMTWDNRGEWHVDHKVPKSYFDHTDPVQVARCWNWRNLQPLWAKDNLSKMITFDPKDLEVLEDAIRPEDVDASRIYMMETA